MVEERSERKTPPGINEGLGVGQNRFESAHVVAAALPVFGKGEDELQIGLRVVGGEGYGDGAMEFAAAGLEDGVVSGFAGERVFEADDGFVVFQRDADESARF